MYQLLIFDWDGTLMDSTQKIANCVRAAALDIGLPEPTDQQAKNIIGLGLLEAMRVLFPDQSDATLQKLMAAYKTNWLHHDDTPQGLFDGVEEGLARLDDSGVMLAVATGKSRQGLSRILQETGLAQHFVTTRCADETRSKPHPQMLHDILERTGLDAHNSIMIGDTTFDMDMAANAGMPALGAGYGVHAEHELRASRALDVVPSFAGVLDWLANGRLEQAYG